MKKRTLTDWIVLGVVFGTAALVVGSSLQNTMKLAELLNMNPFLMAGIVEVSFTTLLFLRGRQRALQLNVHPILHALYYISLTFVTIVNMWGLYTENRIWGLITGATISGLLAGFEIILVWLWTKGHEPHRKSIREIEREADREIEEERVIQRIKYKRWEAKKPSMKLIKKARRDERKRKRIENGKSFWPWSKEEQGLPEYFLQEQETIKEIVAELKKTEPIEIVQEPEQTAEVVPIRQIGFHMEQPKPKPASTSAPRFQPNMKARAEAIETAKALMEELGRIPTKGELMERGVSEYYAKWAKGELKKQ